MSWNFIVFAIVMLFSGVGWVLKQLEAQRAKKLAEESRVRRNEEILRTGRDPFTGEPATARAPVAEAQVQRQERQDLEERRRERLRQLRGQGQRPPAAAPQAAPAQPAGAGGGGGQGPVQIELWPGGPVVVVNQGGKGSPAVPAPKARPAVPVMGRPGAPFPQQQRAPNTGQPAPLAGRSGGSGGGGGGQRKQKRRDRPRGKPPAGQIVGPGIPQQTRAQVQAAAEDAETHRRGQRLASGEMTREAPRPAAVPPSAAIGALPTTPAGWRAAIIASEILGQPVGLRDSSMQAGGRY